MQHASSGEQRHYALMRAYVQTRQPMDGGSIARDASSGTLRVYEGTGLMVPKHAPLGYPAPLERITAFHQQGMGVRAIATPSPPSHDATMSSLPRALAVQRMR